MSISYSYVLVGNTRVAESINSLRLNLSIAAKFSKSISRVSFKVTRENFLSIKTAYFVFKLPLFTFLWSLQTAGSGKVYLIHGVCNVATRSLKPVLRARRTLFSDAYAVLFPLGIK